MPELSISNILLFTAFILPGAVSLKVYRLLNSLPDSPLKENVIEAGIFSLINFALCYWPISYSLNKEIFENHFVVSYFLLILSFFVFPAIWPFLLRFILVRMESWGFIRPEAKTPWDHYFNSLTEGSYVIIHMNDGSYTGGVYGEKSFASSYPSSGDIYLEELWEVDATGNFTGNQLPEQGMIVTKDQYKYIRVST